MGVQITGGLAALLSFVAAVVLIAGASMREFVDAYLPLVDGQDVATLRDSTPILANVGVYTTTFNAAGLENVPPEVAAALPTEDATFPTADFPLLFPVHVNYIADVFPINFDTLAAIDQGLFGGAPVATDALSGVLTPFVEQEFINCSFTVSNEVELLNNVLFAVLGEFIPKAIPGFASDPALDELNVNISRIFGPLGTFQANPLVGFLITTLNNAQAAIDAPDNGVECPEGVPKFQCLAGVVGQGLAAQPLPESLNNFVSAALGPVAQCDDTLSIVECLQTVKFALDLTAPYFGETEFSTEVFGDVTLCDLLSADCDESYSNYAADVKSILDDLVLVLSADPGNEANLAAAAQLNALAGGLTTFNGLFQAAAAYGALPPAFNLQQGIVIDPNLQMPPTFNSGKFQPVCLQAFFADFPAVGEPPECPFGNFFGTLAASIPDQGLQALFGQVALLLQQCQVTPGFDEDNGPLGCVPFISTVFLRASMVGGVEVTTAATEDAIALCLDQADDRARVIQGQVLVGSGIVVHFMSAIIGVFAMQSMSSGQYAMVAGSLTALTASLLTVSSLIVISKAPIYESVGGGEDGGIPQFEPYYDLGIVSVLALTSTALGVIAAVVYAIGGGVEAYTAKSKPTEKVEEEKAAPEEA